jgi:multidrug resistance efflux pump
MEPLPPIPSPPGHLWREIRYRVLPVVVFLGGCLSVTVLWQFQGGGRSLTGVGEGVRTTVVSPQPGTIQELLVQPYSHVRQGEPVAIFQPFDPRADLDLLRTRLDLARLRATPTLSEASAVDLERLRLDLLQTQSDLAVARVRLELAESDLARNEPLYREKLVAEDIYELSRSTRDMVKAEVEEKARTVSAMELRMREIEERELTRASPVPQEQLFGQLEELETAARTNWGSLTLVAPIAGTVGMFLRYPGEFMVEGETLVTVQSDRAERIVGYLRQPFGFDPRPGLSVVVSLRSAGRKRFVSEIRHVGAQFEVITNSLAIVRDGVLLDAGLPIVIDVPSDIHIRPGEIVDLLIKASTRLMGPMASAGAAGDLGQ